MPLEDLNFAIKLDFNKAKKGSAEAEKRFEKEQHMMAFFTLIWLLGDYKETILEKLRDEL